jgi:hypothetical protein
MHARPRRLGLAAAIALLATLSLAGTARSAAVIVGSPLTESFSPAIYVIPSSLTVQTALPEPGTHTSSPVSGTVLRWTLREAKGTFRLRVLRPSGGGAYTAVGTSPPANAIGLDEQTFGVGLPIQAGDVLGLENSAVGDQLAFAAVPGASISSWVPSLAEGQSRTPDEVQADVEVGFNAEVQPAPAIAAAAPASGPYTGGTAVTIAGTDFVGVTGVSFGGTPAAGFGVSSESLLTAVAPPGKPGTVEITVTASGGVSAATPGSRFTYTACKVPKLVGKKLKTAKRRIRKAGCRVGRVKRRRGSRRKAARVLKQRPAAGKLRLPGAKVNLTLG